MGDRGEREGLAEHGDFDTSLFEHAIGLEDRLVPIGVADIEREEGIAECVDQLLHPSLAISEFPMSGHGVRSEQLQAVNHVLTLGPVGSERALPSVPAIEQQNTILATFRTDGLYDGGGAIETADATILACECCEVVRVECVPSG